MPEQVFTNVWYLPDENTWSDLNLLAFRDTGTLIIRDGSLEFQGTKGRVMVTPVRRISFGKQGRDFVNNWVKVEYGTLPSPSTAFFADGSGLGWGGVLGGTERILSAIQKVQTVSKESEIENARICESCKTANRPSAKFCMNCGKALSQN